MKKLFKTISVIICAAFVLALVPVNAFAAGGFYVDSTYVEVAVGSTAYVTVGASNSVGQVSWSGGSAANASGTEWLDNSTASIAIYGAYAGTDYVYVNAPDVATYDEEQTEFYQTITVVVYDPTPVTEPTTEVPETDPVTEPNTEVPETDPVTEPNTEVPETDPVTEPTTEVPETNPVTEPYTTEPQTWEEITTEAVYEEPTRSIWEILSVSVGEMPKSICQYIPSTENYFDEYGNEIEADVPELKGFTTETVDYDTVPVQVLKFQELVTVYVLQDDSTGEYDYYTLDEESGQFEQLPYMTVNDRLYVILNFADTFEVPEGYKLVSVNIGNCNVQAIQRIAKENSADEAVEPATEEETTEQLVYAGNNGTEVILKNRVLLGAEVSTIQGEDPLDDIYYIYCLVDGKQQLYSYDISEETIQRAAFVDLKLKEDAEPETETEAETETETTTAPEATGLFGLSRQSMLLLIALAIAVILLIVFVILYLIRGHRYNSANTKKKTKTEVKANVKDEYASLDEDEDSDFDDDPDEGFDDENEEEFEEDGEEDAGIEYEDVNVSLQTDYSHTTAYEDDENDVYDESAEVEVGEEYGEEFTYDEGEKESIFEPLNKAFLQADAEGKNVEDTIVLSRTLKK